MNKSLDWSLFEEFVGRLNDLWETEAWQKANHHDHTNGLSQKAVNSYRREHPGSKLKTAVTTKPSKLKAGSKAAKRRKSFCARMGGNKGPMKKPNGKPTPKALALRRWHCESIEEMAYMIARGEQMIAEMKQGLPEEAKHGLYYNVNKRKAAGTSRPASSPKAPTAQAWKDAAKTTKKEGVAEGLKSMYHNAVAKHHGRKADDAFDDGDEEGFKKSMDKNISHKLKAGEKIPQVRDPKKFQQGVAEGAPELLKKEMPLHRHAEKLLAQNGVSKDDPDYHHHLNNTIKHLRQFGNIDLINKSDEQGVAEDDTHQIKGNELIEYLMKRFDMTREQAIELLKKKGLAEDSDTYKQGHAKFHTKTNKQVGPTHYGRGSSTKADSYTKADPRYHEVRPVKEQGMAEGWSKKYKSSINCSHPKGFSQKAHCAGKNKHNESHEVMEMICPDCGMCEAHSNMTINEIAKGAKDSNGVTKCWPGKHAVGTKKGKNGGQVRNCVPNESMLPASAFTGSDKNKINGKGMLRKGPATPGKLVGGG